MIHGSRCLFLFQHGEHYFLKMLSRVMLIIYSAIHLCELKYIEYFNTVLFKQPMKNVMLEYKKSLTVIILRQQLSIFFFQSNICGRIKSANRIAILLFLYIWVIQLRSNRYKIYKHYKNCTHGRTLFRNNVEI